MAVNVKMGVDLSGFTAGIREGQGILKGLNAEMKATEAEFKATGNAEQMLAAKTKTLTSQLNIQKGIADQASKALKAMADAGIDPANAAYQKMYATMMNATAGMNSAQAELNALAAGTETAAAGADQLSASMQSLGKKVSLEQVISGIDSITNGLENAARKAVKLGEDLWNAIMENAQWADDTSTQAQMFGIDLDTFQRMQKLVTNGLDTTLDAMLRSQQKFNNNIGKGADEFVATMVELGLATETAGGKTGETFMSLVTDDQLDLFFRAGQAIMGMTDAFEQENTAQKLFGKSWKELVPLFSTYKTVEEYNAALEGVKVNSEEDVNALAELNDKVGQLKGDFDTLSRDVMAQLAPALTDTATALDGLLGSLLEYLQKPEGQEMLEKLGTAVSGLFEDLGKIDPEQVVSGFTDVFTTVVSGVQWLTDNWESVVGALEGIVIGWGALKLTGGILDIVKVVGGLGDLVGMKAAGEAAGAAWGGGFAAAIGKAAPWLIGLWTLLNPAPGEDATGNNTIIDEKGNLTGEGNLYGYRQTESGETYLDRRQIIEDAAQTAWDLYRTNQLDAEALATLKEKVMSEEGFTSLVDLFMGAREGNENWKGIEDLDLTEWANKYGMPEIPVDLTPATDAAAIAEQIGTVIIPAALSFGAGIQNMLSGLFPGFANGIHSVPYDGMLARLHKGERVVPAREVQSRNYSSNLYVESMIMNNGTDAAGLASAMAAAQRRTMAGYGS